MPDVGGGRFLVSEGFTDYIIEHSSRKPAVAVCRLALFQKHTKPVIHEWHFLTSPSNITFLKSPNQSHMAENFGDKYTPL